MYRSVATSTTRGGMPTDSGDAVVRLDQVPLWTDSDQRSPANEDPSLPYSYFSGPLTSPTGADGGGDAVKSRFPVDHEINSKIYLWRGNPWNLEVDAVVNSSNETLDEAHSSPGLHAAAGPGLAEECATLGGCRTGMAKVTNAYDLPARRIIHTVGPKYAVKYHTAAENALSHCYRSCLALLIENGLQSIAMGCIYTEAKNYPREPAAHVAIRTVRRFLEKQRDKISAVVFCTTTASDTEIYRRLLPLYFPRDKHEEEVAISKLPADVGDENGETTIDERKIRIKPLPAVSAPVQKPPANPVDLPVSEAGLTLTRNSFQLDSYLDPTFMSLIKNPDQHRKEQWEKAAQAQGGFNLAKMLGFGDLAGPPLSAAEEYSLHSRYLAKANSLNLSEIAEMKIVYRGGVDCEGRSVMVVVGAHFLLRCLDLERFVLYVVKEFEPLIQKPYTIVYIHSAASLQVQPDLGWMKRLQQILGRKHQRNLHAIYVLHPTLGLKAATFALQLFVDGEVWKKVVHVDRLLQMFRYVPREQLTIPDFVFQHDLEVNGGKGIIVDPRTKVFLNLVVENNGPSDTSEIFLAFPPTEAEHIAILQAAATAEGKRKKKTHVPLEVKPTELPNTPNGAKLFSVALHKPLKSSEKAVLEVIYAVIHSLEPFPAEISQSEPQYVYYRDSAVLLSPYHVVEQITYIKMPNKKVESYTRVDPTKHAGTELKYGHYHDQPSYSFSPIIVHFENNNPFAIVEELVRVLEISHWGNLQVTEHYKLKHGGAHHKGVFSRLEYQGRQSISGAASFRHLLARLPPRVHSVYYRDGIGNISTSHLRTDTQKSELEIEPRYPLFGGWKATFVIGYGLPLNDFLFESPEGQRYLNFSFGCPLLETVVDKLTIKVVLPEGAKNPSAAVPFPVEQQLETTYSYLDVIGRTTVVIKKSNVVPEHHVPFQVYYDFSPIFMLAEPLMLVSAFFLFFVACIAYLNIDLSIRKSS